MCDGFHPCGVCLPRSLSERFSRTFVSVENSYSLLLTLKGWVHPKAVKFSSSYSDSCLLFVFCFPQYICIVLFWSFPAILCFFFLGLAVFSCSSIVPQSHFCPLMSRHHQPSATRLSNLPTQQLASHQSTYFCLAGFSHTVGFLSCFLVLCASDFDWMMHFF